MRAKLVYLCIVVQCAVLATIVFQREQLIATGMHIFVQTAPIDPRDIFRGDFVRLHYDFSNPNISHLNEKNKKGTIVYACLQKNSGEIYTYQQLCTTKPKSGIFIRGRIQHSWKTNSTVSYGIEKYFIEQNAGKDIEKKLSDSTGMQTPMEVELAVNDNGLATICGYRWSQLGIQTTITPPGNQSQKSPLITIRIKNTSKENLYIVNDFQNSSFLLKHEYRYGKQFFPATLPSPHHYKSNDFHLLKPHEIYTTRINLNKKQWYVKEASPHSPAMDIGSIKSHALFRLIYTPPHIEHLPEGLISAPVWQGILPSRAFQSNAVLD